jgi:hypothetical protein
MEEGMKAFWNSVAAAGSPPPPLPAAASSSMTVAEEVDEEEDEDGDAELLDGEAHQPTSKLGKRFRRYTIAY